MDPKFLPEQDRVQSQQLQPADRPVGHTPPAAAGIPTEKLTGALFRLSACAG